MSLPAYNRHEIAETLKEAGVEPALSEAVGLAIDTLSREQLATKDDLKKLDERLSEKIQDLSEKTKGLPGQIKGLTERVDGLEGRLGNLEQNLSGRMENLEQNLSGRLDILEP
ncbi:MAG: hypothetical protein OXU22_08750, partial [Gammaproteobacteria bacterium]|nr:hypothetical protein [Gammaproteobacteria bacterium]